MKKRLFRVACFSFIVLFLGTFLAALQKPEVASATTPQAVITAANSTARWVDRVTIEVISNGTTYVFKDGGGLNDDRDYKFQIVDSRCHGEISGFPGGQFLDANTAAANVHFDIDFAPPNSGCEDPDEGEFNATIANPGNAMIAFRWVSQTRIQTVDGAGDWIFTDDTTNPDFYFLREGDDGCQDKLFVNDERTHATLYELDGGGGGSTAPPEALAGSGCSMYVDRSDGSDRPERNNPPSLVLMPLGNLDQADQESEDYLEGEGGVQPSCESEAGEWSWVMCPVMRLLDKAISGVDSAITSLLTIKYDRLTSTGSIETAWSRIRNLAYIILIPILLVMVIGTALGFDLLDAYTIKRSLPRLLAAVIFMALSWDICRIMIEVTNGVGQGIAGLIGGTVREGGISELELQDVFGSGEGVFASFLGLGAAGAVVVASKLTILGPLLGILLLQGALAALTLLIGFLLLSLRQMIIVALVILSPLAILAWVFPGNDKLWKLWWNSFSKLLLLFPIIIVLITTGKVFAWIVFETGGTAAEGIASNLIEFTLKIVAYIGPYFFIPAAFKLAGGAFANLAGMVNDRSRGVFDRGRKARQKKWSTAKEHAGRRTLASRANRYDAWKEKRDSSKGLRRRLYGLGARTVGGYDINAADSARRAQVAKELNDTINSGKDDEIRGLTVNKEAALKTNEGDMWQYDKKTGVRQFRSLGGRWINEADVDAGQRRWKGDIFAQQAALSYEMRKASTEQELQSIANNYHAVAKGWGMSERQATGAWIGAAFENQNQHLEFKNMRFGDNYDAEPRGMSFDEAKAQQVGANSMRMDAAGYENFIKEVYEKRGNYNMAQQSSNFFEKAKDSFDTFQNELAAGRADLAAAGNRPDKIAAAQQRIKRAQDNIEMTKGVAETLMSRYRIGAQGAGGIQGMEGEIPIMQQGPQVIIPNQPQQPAGQQQIIIPGQPQQQAAQGAQPQQFEYQVNIPAAASTAERAREFAVHVGQYQELDPTTRTTSHGIAPPPDNKRQN